MQRSQNLSLKDRVYLQIRYGLDPATLKSITRLGLNRDQAVWLLEERSKRGLPPVSVWSNSTSTV